MKRIKNQKSKIVNLLVLMWLMMSCGEVEKGQYAIDNVPPGQVSKVSVDNIKGGAIITYTVPDDEDLLYVKVLYTMSDGTPAEQKSSAYTSKITVEGLGRSQKQIVQLICGDRSGNESAPYLQEIEPLDAPIYDIQESMEMTEDFGGVMFTWKNPMMVNIVLTIYVLDEDNKFVEIDNVYSNFSSGQYNVRGFPSEEATFSVIVRDRWKNKTEMKSGTFIPLHEEKLDRFLFTRWNPVEIPYSVYGSQHIELMWNGITENETGFMCATTRPVPHSITFNMGQLAKLSRIKVWQRTNGTTLAFAIGNVRKFQMWGSPHPNVTDEDSTWIFLGNFESIKPSDAPIGATNSVEELAYARAGEDYNVQANRDVAVQYIRLHYLELWNALNGATICEIEIYGDVQKQ